MTQWKMATYPGDTVRVLALRRGREVGEIRIQQYSGGTQSVRVASFLPGNFVCLPGDTGKTEPEKHEWCSSEWQANEIFERYAHAAYAEGWQNYYG